jgi:hypothetical protein
VRLPLLVGMSVLCAGPLFAQKAPLAGWPGVFPDLPGYARRIETPTAGQDPMKEYRQTATYEWTGGDIRTLKATLARFPTEKDRAIPRGAEKVLLGKRTAWLADGVLVVPLGEGRLLRLEGGGSEAGKDVLPLARRFPLDRIATALESPPRRAAPRSVEAFRAITRDMTYGDLTAWIGDADSDIGSGIHIMQFTLPEGGIVRVGTPDFVKIFYIRHIPKEGKAVDLLP